MTLPFLFSFALYTNSTNPTLNWYLNGKLIAVFHYIIILQEKT
ncbi:hypothetical protein bmyco0003_10630 [Bacillus pseudomycoides]|nr:hypothetical protein bmyco0003_10630 [Bacillus pseudomycoides]